MGHKPEPTRLSAAPESDDIAFVTNYFNEYCNCYSYAVQDYLAGYISKDIQADFDYLPRPGQTRGRTYQDLWLSPEGMRRAIHEDGIDFAGMKYPKRIPPGHYVICCFLEPGEYHFIRQNRDGSWSSKDGRSPPTRNGADKKPLINPEDYYGGDKRYQFVGYFFVPEGGVRVGIRGYETRRLAALCERTQNPAEKVEKSVLEELVPLSDYGDYTVREMRDIFAKKGIIGHKEMTQLWDNYNARFLRKSKLLKNAGWSRISALKDAYTRPKNARLEKDTSR